MRRIGIPPLLRRAKTRETFAALGRLWQRIDRRQTLIRLFLVLERRGIQVGILNVFLKEETREIVALLRIEQ